MRRVVCATWKRFHDSWWGRRECLGTGRQVAASYSLSPGGKLKILSLPQFYLDMFQPPPADEDAAKADGDAGEDEEDEGARCYEDKVVELQLEQSWGRLLQVSFNSISRHLSSNLTHPRSTEVITMISKCMWTSIDQVQAKYAPQDQLPSLKADSDQQNSLQGSQLCRWTLQTILNQDKSYFGKFTKYADRTSNLPLSGWGWTVCVLPQPPSPPHSQRSEGCCWSSRIWRPRGRTQRGSGGQPPCPARPSSGGRSGRWWARRPGWPLSPEKVHLHLWTIDAACCHSGSMQWIVT